MFDKWTGLLGKRFPLLAFSPRLPLNNPYHSAVGSKIKED